MKVRIQRACGHREVRALYGAKSEREIMKAYLESTVCDNCYSQQKHPLYPSLKGDYKTVHWAIAIREQMFELLIEYGESPEVAWSEKTADVYQQRLNKLFKKKKKADWFIQNRPLVGEDVYQLLLEN
jgi:S-adenosylmethionine:diacylglycerol 3-amino-3-carboxypropyl transferase